jgi:hypothetical protein
MKINAKILVLALWVIALRLLWQAANNSETITTGGVKIRWVALLGTI